MCHGYWNTKGAGYGWGPGHGRKHRHWGYWQQPGRHFGQHDYRPPVNLSEHDDRYELFLVAPGRAKEDFRLSVKDLVLTIAVQQPESAATEQWKRQEYRLESFERQFKLNEKVDTEGISARYSDGILQVKLPKFPGTETPDQEILVA